MAPTRDEQATQIVGIDGSEGSLHALRWALARTALFGPVQPVMTWQYPWWALLPTSTGTVAPPSETEFAAITENIAREQLDKVSATRRSDPMIVHGSPGPTLVDVADQGSLLVVGSRGRGALASGVLGSTSQYCVQHGRRPVVVVPPSAPLDDLHHRVVVGVDGSDRSMEALQWAIDNTPMSSRIDVVHAWESDSAYSGPLAVATERLAELSARLVADAIDRVKPPTEGVSRVIEGQSRQGDARPILRQESTTCDLIVVGARGHSALVDLLLGSTTTSLVHQPETATVVVPSS